MSGLDVLRVINIIIWTGVGIVLATMKIADCIMSYKDWREQKRNENRKDNVSTPKGL